MLGRACTPLSSSRLSVTSTVFVRNAVRRLLSTETAAETSLAAAASSAQFSIKDKAREGRPAYLDFQATTPLDPRVLDAMLPYMMSRYGNPHSRTHSFGWETEKAIEDARDEVAAIIGASGKEIIFTSGATESNNMAIKGVARYYVNIF
jgi:cysteine desulfurase